MVVFACSVLLSDVRDHLPDVIEFGWSNDLNK